MVKQLPEMPKCLYNKESALSEFKNQIMYKDGIVVTKATIVAHVED